MGGDNRGPSKGCPGSPILFLLYISSLETRLQNSDCGFRIQKRGDFWKPREGKYTNIPALLFADDLILMGRNFTELEKLLEITSQFGDEKKLAFNPTKSAVMAFSKCSIGTERAVQVQGKEIPRTSHYKYLGITVADSENYLDIQQDIWRAKSRTVLNQLQARALWGFNRF